MEAATGLRDSTDRAHLVVTPVRVPFPRPLSSEGAVVVMVVAAAKSASATKPAVVTLLVEGQVVATFLALALVQAVVGWVTVEKGVVATVHVVDWDWERVQGVGVTL